LLAERGSPRLIQVGYDWITAGALGGHLGSVSGDVALIRAMNDELRRALPGDAVFVDLAEISGQMGRESFYDPRRYHWTKQPFSEVGVSRLAEHLNAAIRAASTGPRKVLVLDLDNTLWGGVVGELGPLGIGLGESPEGEAFRDFQEAAAGLARRGIVLAVASKNNPDDAREPFEQNPDMVLSLDDFASFEASWDPKDVVLRRISQQLRLGLEDFVFFDDNPAERELIRQSLPEVSVVEVPDEPSEYVRALERGLYFESRSVTDADRERSAQYQTERDRRALEGSAQTMEDYLASLEMRGSIRDIDDASMQRVVQLLGKTNQWNLTTRRLSESDVRMHLDKPGAVGLTLQLEDRFGDYGLISVLIAEREQTTLRITDWLMSCRVIGRTAEQFVFGALLGRARSAGIEGIVGEYTVTKKNGMVADLFPRLGFQTTHEDDAAATYRLALDAAEQPQTSVESE
jgi:FkbH-like protein